MGKAVINTHYGGFGISKEVYDWLKEHNIDEKYIKCIRNTYYYYDGPRHHPLLIQCIEELGEESNDILSNLTIIEFEGDEYIIDEYDGWESIRTPKDINWINVNDL